MATYYYWNGLPMTESMIIGRVAAVAGNYSAHPNQVGCYSCPPVQTQTRHTAKTWAPNDWECCYGTVFRRRFTCSQKNYVESLSDYVPNSFRVVYWNAGTYTVSGLTYSSCDGSIEFVNAAHWIVSEVEWYTYD
jgi:hypothetical protein